MRAAGAVSDIPTYLTLFGTAALVALGSAINMISMACSVPGVLKQAVYPAALGRVHATPDESETVDTVQPPLSSPLPSGLAARATPAAGCFRYPLFAAVLLL